MMKNLETNSATSVLTDRTRQQFWRWLMLVMLALPVSPVTLIAAPQDSERSIEIIAGFDGQAKLGHWIPITIVAGAEAELTLATGFRVTNLDGDDTLSTVEGPLVEMSRGTESKTFQAWTRLGRAYGKLEVSLVNDAGESLAQQTVSLSGMRSAESIAPATASMILCLGADSTLTQSLAQSLTSAARRDPPRIVAVTDPAQLPVNSLAWSGLEAVVLLTNDVDWIESLDPRSVSAMLRWVDDGGRLVVSASPTAMPVFRAGGALERMVPGRIAEPMTMKSSRSIEDFAASRQQLIRRDDPPVILAGLSNVSGRVTVEQDGLPLLVRRRVGFGSIDFLTLDLADARLKEWSGYNGLLQRVMEPGADGQESRMAESNRGTAVRHFGYQDLMGQLRAPLDQFSTLRFIPFMVIASLIGLYILCIGPGDYFLVNRLLKRHEWTWVSFPLITLLFCAAAWLIASRNRPSEMQLNQLEIIDIDAATGDARGNAWMTLYSPDAASATLGLAIDAEQPMELDDSVLTWMGLPGDGLGGLSSGASPTLSNAVYQHTFTSLRPVGGSDLTADDPAISFRESLHNVPLQVSATKPFFGQWHGRLPLKIDSRLEMRDRLRGTFTNPFDVPLVNCKLLFQDWAYVMSRPLDAGEIVDVFSETREKTARGILTRRRNRVDDSNKSQNRPWDPQDMSMLRIADMLMFHDAAGGQQYTGLTHDYHDHVDLTSRLTLGTAVLVGELKNGPMTRMTIDGEPAQSQYDHTDTIVRILFPVEYDR